MPHSTPPNNNFPPNINPLAYSYTAILVGTILIEDLNFAELNSLGNWFMLVGQFLITNSGQQQLIESRIEKNNININSKKCKNGFGPYTSNSNKSNQNVRDEVEFILQKIQIIEQQLKQMQKDSNS